MGGLFTCCRAEHVTWHNIPEDIEIALLRQLGILLWGRVCQDKAFEVTRGPEAPAAFSAQTVDAKAQGKAMW